MNVKKLIYTMLFCVLPTIIWAQDKPVYYNFNTIPVHQLLPSIGMRFVNSGQFTVIQWDLKAGAKLYPPHKHINEQVTRILEGEVDAYSDDKVYHLHAGDVMIFAPNVPHGFIAITEL